MSSLAAFAADLAAGSLKIVDLTQTLAPDFPTIVLPPQFGQCAPFRMEVISRYDDAGPGWFWHNISVGEHTGTHFDAPVHWVTGKDLQNNTTDTLVVQNLIAPASVVDCSADAANNGDYLLTVATLEAWEVRHGKIPAGNWVLFRTDWSKRSGAAYSNMMEDGAHTPGPDAAAVQWLVDRGVLGLGVETIGTDAGQAHTFTPMYPAHTLMHGAGRYGLQCLCNLDQLPATGAMIVAAPLKILGGSGSPLRVLAIVPA
ncbi:MAG: cyclase family protein [Acetobacteraceae bacterium]|nr:cyclase family protein [Acetobacteraceae bacterium]